MSDSRKNFAISNIATAPSPANSGNLIVIYSGHGTRFPTPPFNATIGPADAFPHTLDNSEIVRVTNISGDNLTITRAQETTTARAIIIGDLVYASVTKKTLDDAEAAAEKFACTFDGQGQNISANIAFLDAVAQSGNLAYAILISTYQNGAAMPGNVNVAVSRYTPSGGTLGNATLLGNVSLTGNAYLRDTTLSGWTKTLTAGDVLSITPSAIANVQRLRVVLST